ncbi:MAG: hypothetical protein BGO38_12650 [Cellulomonas sp. 73-145]|uniref:glycoside hydrolase family 43 protein n=1 Tax=Cellulomonas sp. 73-145 TaxID=1895739 RepID=UPI00092CDF59|nr:glycoside hydrolase family 43 protein [Cellulomonas sp. 73-145]MBN9325716.1 family 43 glycosylhydrolase [Cellulomonas sp.]OJV59644.1 MAG: hypothetical protein BGO38_12650 [Cellulomonas sp. 73-145]
MKRPGRLVALGVLLLAVTGCAAGAGNGSRTASPTQSADRFAPVIDEDFPDPDVVAAPDGWRAFATGMSGLNVRIASSTDLSTWTVQRRDALPTLPAWATPGRTWAPDVSRRADGTWIMYVAAQDAASGRQCIGVATSPTIDGDFTPASDRPIVCPVAEGGAIDPSTFQDTDGTRYLLWKTDGNCCGQDTWIEISTLSQDGLSLVGPATRLIKESLPWEGSVVEAPVLVRHDAEYALFYSANAYGGDAYAVGVARATSLLGPYTKQPEPVLSTDLSGGRLHGPGGQDVVATPNGDVLFFHAWDELFTYRALHRAPLTWRPDGTVAVAGLDH